MAHFKSKRSFFIITTAKINETAMDLMEADLSEDEVGIDFENVSYHYLFLLVLF